MTPDKIVRRLLAANPGTTPNQPLLSGTGNWLHWHSPAGELLLVGVTATLDGTTYRQLASADDITKTVATLWSDAVAAQLGKLLDATAAAINAGTELPDGISAQAIPIVRGNSPASIMDRLWRSGPADALLLKKIDLPITTAQAKNTPAAEQVKARNNPG